MKARTPELRVRACNAAPVRAGGRYVLYWMIATRRTTWSHALDRAVERAVELGKPLVVFEPLRVAYRWASERFHRFVLDGMRANRDALADAPALYYPYVEPRPDADKGLLAALAAEACVVVTDEAPCFFLPRMVASAARALDVRLEAIDSYGLMPLRAAGKTFYRAHDFRRFLHRELPGQLEPPPRRNALARVELPRLRSLPPAIADRWPAADERVLAGRTLAELPIDHDVLPPEDVEGGAEAARRLLQGFEDERLRDYAEGGNQPGGTSRLSAHLHFGHLSAREVFQRVARAEDWEPERVRPSSAGSRHGWWRMTESSEAFLDELITWREVGANFCFREANHAEYESLPGWARETLAQHASDEREHVYDLTAFDEARTHSELWNAIQRQLRTEGRIESYLRMVWGKKILHWSRSPREAYDVMVELNNRYALDGRDPNSYSGIGWVLGRYDRPWGPERPVFGKIRYMTTESTRRKLKLAEYLERWGPADLFSGT